MHRLHHEHSDTVLDPHTPVFDGIFSVALKQVNSYELALRNLIKKKEPHYSVAKDFDFQVSWFNRKKLWYLPYVIHGAVAGMLILLIGKPGIFIAAAYWLGMMSHPIQGWMVNALAHKWGYRNFVIPDNSQNNTAVAWLVMGEGYQNNHHRYPRSAKFSVKWWEVDMGYALCRIGKMLGMLEIPKAEPRSA